jgi:hypothetical protein
MMQRLVDAYGAVYADPRKGHDRVFLDKENQFFAVFDGAGGDELSEAAVQALPATLARHSSVRQQSPARFVEQVLSDVDCLDKGQERKSTVALACIDEQADQTLVTYAHAGDASLYFFDTSADSFNRIAHTPTSYIPYGDYVYTDTAEFLGAARPPEQIAPLVGQLILPRQAQWLILGLTDGVQDDTERGISFPQLEELVRHTKPAALPNQLLNSIVKYDDASVFVVSHMEESV